VAAKHGKVVGARRCGNAVAHARPKTTRTRNKDNQQHKEIEGDLWSFFAARGSARAPPRTESHVTTNSLHKAQPSIGGAIAPREGGGGPGGQLLAPAASAELLVLAKPEPGPDEN